MAGGAPRGGSELVDDDSYCVNEPSVISEVIDGETIVLNFDSGHYYSFNGSASEIWQHVAAGRPVAAVVERVALHFAVDATAIHGAVAGFVDRLAEENLIRRADGGAVAAAPIAPAASDAPIGTFGTPTFEKFTDMEELLLLDPIHEVSDAGWPRKPE